MGSAHSIQNWTTLHALWPFSNPWLRRRHRSLVWSPEHVRKARTILSTKPLRCQASLSLNLEPKPWFRKGLIITRGPRSLHDSCAIIQLQDHPLLQPRGKWLLRNTIRGYHMGYWPPQQTDRLKLFLCFDQLAHGKQIHLNYRHH